MWSWAQHGIAHRGPRTTTFKTRQADEDEEKEEKDDEGDQGEHVVEEEGGDDECANNEGGTHSESKTVQAQPMPSVGVLSFTHCWPGASRRSPSVPAFGFVVVMIVVGINI